MIVDTQPIPRRRGRPPVLSPQDRRRSILTAAESVFSQAGYAGASMEKIAETAGMSKKTLYEHFTTKRALFEAFAEDQDASAVLEDEPIECSMEALRTSFRRTVLFALSPRQVQATRLMIAEGSAEAGLSSSFHQRVIVRAQERHAELVATLARKAGKSLPDTNLLSRQMFSCAFGDLHLLALLGVDMRNLELQIDQQIDNAMQLLDAYLSRS